MKLRKLGEKEIWGLQYNKVSPLNICLYFKLNQKIDSNNIQSVANKMLQKYQALNLFIQDDYFYDRKHYNHQTVNLGQYSLPRFESAIVTEVMTSFDFDNGPLFRISYFLDENQTHILMTFSHITIDGRSAFLLACDFISYLLNNKALPMLSDAFYPLKLNLEALLIVPKTQTQEVECENNNKKNKFKVSQHNPIDLTSQYKNVVLNNDLLSHILKLSKKYQLSYTSILGAAELISAYQVIKLIEQDQEMTFNFSTMLDLRPFLCDNNAIIGNFVMPLMFPVTINADTTLKTLASELKYKLHHPVIHQKQIDQGHKIIRPTIGLTSIGNMDPIIHPISQYIAEIQGFNAIQGFLNTDYSFSLGSLSYNGKSYIPFSYPKPITSKDFINQIYNNLIGMLYEVH